MWRKATPSETQCSPASNDAPSRLEAADLLATQPAPTPLLIPAISFAIGIAIADQITRLPNLTTGVALCVIAGIWCILALVIARAPRSGRFIAIGLAFGLCGLLRMQSAQSLPSDHIKHYLPTEPAPARLIGTVASSPRMQPGILNSPFYPRRPDPRVRFLLRVSHAECGDERVPLSGLVQISVSPAISVPVQLGDSVRLTGWLSGIHPPLNPGCFDWQAYQARRGVFAQLSVDKLDDVVATAGEGSSTLRWQRNLRAWVQRLLYGETAPDDTRRLLDVLVLGQRSAADRELNERFIRLGAAPYLAVSGFHVGVLALTVALLGRLFLSRQRTAWLVLAALLGYLTVVEPNPPVLRATLMGVLACLALILNRPFAPLNWWAASGLLLLIINPQYLFDVGFQFTFAMVLVLLTVLPVTVRWWRQRTDVDPLEERPTEANTLLGLSFRKLKTWLLDLVIVCVVLWIAGLPLVSFYFGRIAMSGFLCTILVGPLVAVAILAGIGSLLINGLLSPFDVSLNLASPFIHGLDVWTQWLDRWLAWTQYTYTVPWWAVVLSYLPAIFWPMLREVRYRTVLGRPTAWSLSPRAVLGCLLIPNGVLWGAWTLHGSQPTPTSIDLLALSRGSGAIIHTRGDTLLIDGGTLGNWDAANTISDDLRQIDNPRLSGAILTGQTAGYFSAWPSLLERYPIGWIDPGPALTTNTAAISRLKNALAKQPQLTLPAEYTLGDWRITQLPTASGKRALLFETNHTRLLYALALDVDEFAAVVDDLTQSSNALAITAAIAPARSGSAVERVIRRAQQLGAQILIFHLPPHEPAWQTLLKRRPATQPLNLVNLWESGAVRLVPNTGSDDANSSRPWRVIPLTKRVNTNKH